MEASSDTLHPRQIPVLLRGEVAAIVAWLERWSARRVALYLVVIFAGAGSYGAAMGWWRDPQQAVYAAIKFPLVILLTTFGNALLNAMLAPLLGLNLAFRQSLLAMLMSFTIASAILGAFSPLILFLVLNAPPLQPGVVVSENTYVLIQLTQVAVIAFAGLAANLRLLQLLRQLGGSVPVARKVLCAWLAGNLLLGSQLVWILRPFIGLPGLPVEFLRPNAFAGNFYETVFHSIGQLFAF